MIPNARSKPLVTRRSVVIAAALGGQSLLPRALCAAATDGSLALEAKPGEIRFLPGAATPVWGYGGRVPGPEIRVRQAGEVHARLINGIGEAMTVAFPADNPGKWMHHGHMLEHQMAGMSAHFEVARS